MPGVAHIARMAASWITATSRICISTPPPSKAPFRPASTNPHCSPKRSRTRCMSSSSSRPTGIRTPGRLSSSSAATWRSPTNQLKDYDSLRFQIEFNVRDAKQYWGLADFMNVTETAVTNAAHLSLFMVNVSYHVLHDGRQSDPACSLLDLKARFRADKDVTETITMLPEKPEPVLLAQIFTKIAGIGRMHAGQAAAAPA
jgi:hypothetical protein